LRFSPPRKYTLIEGGRIVSRVTLSGDHYVLFVLLFKMGIAASLAGVLITSSFFKRLIFLDTRNTKENWQFALIFGSLLTAGSAVRVLVGYEGMDLSLAGTFIVGLMGGIVPGSSVGFFVSMPQVLRGEWLALPFTVLCGFVGGLIRKKRDWRDEFWDFSPFFLNNIVRSVRSFTRERRVDSRATILLSVLTLDILRTYISAFYGGTVLFAFTPERWWVTVCVWLSTLACVGIPLKIWNNTRVEMLLEEQRSLAVQARFDALRSQINPHFLFNTLNTATSLLWSEPAKARWVLVKLSGILRRLLKDSSDFVPLSKEIEFVNDYLSLEVTRFGEDRLVVEKEIDPKSLDVPVPSMILQPIVENAVKHGAARNVGGGVIRISTENRNDSLVIRISDNGPGFRKNGREGIGLRNVREKLRVAYGSAASLRIESSTEGAEVVIELPVKREGMDV